MCAQNQDLIFDSTPPYHCSTCMNHGRLTPRAIAITRYNGSSNKWIHAFPCLLSAREYASLTGDLGITIVAPLWTPEVIRQTNDRSMDWQWVRINGNIYCYSEGYGK